MTPGILGQLVPYGQPHSRPFLPGHRLGVAALEHAMDLLHTAHSMQPCGGVMMAEEILAMTVATKATMAPNIMPVATTATMAVACPVIYETAPMVLLLNFAMQLSRSDGMMPR